MSLRSNRAAAATKDTSHSQERDFAGIVKTVVRKFCPWPQWKVFWEIRVATLYPYFFAQKSRTFDFLAISRKTGQLFTFEIKQHPGYAVKSVERQISLDQQYSDRLFVVAPFMLIERLRSLLPDHVGLIAVVPPIESITGYQVVRKARPNEHRDPFLKLVVLLDVQCTILTWTDRVNEALAFQCERLMDSGTSLPPISPEARGRFGDLAAWLATHRSAVEDIQRLLASF